MIDSKKLILILVVFFSVGTAGAKTFLNLSSNYAIDYTNVYLTGYTLNYDQLFIDQCNTKVAGLANPPNEIRFSQTSVPGLVQRRQDPMGRGYYDDMKMQCDATYVNPTVDCTGGGFAGAPGETRLAVTSNKIDCVKATTTYTCTNQIWVTTKVLYTRLPGCVAK